MDTFGLFNNGKLVLPEKETDFGKNLFAKFMPALC